MKTPRDILLARHRAANPKLDTLREQALATLRPSCRDRSLVDRFVEACRISISMPRFAWGAFATAWAFILVLNIASRDTAQHRAETYARSNEPSEMLQAVREQKRLLVELGGLGDARQTEPPRFIPRPRSERPRELFMT